MSTLRTINVIHPSGSTTNIVNDASGNVTVGNDLTVTGALVPSSSFKRNRIINGNMLIDQRNAGAAINSAASGSFPVDRFVYYTSQTGKFNLQQNAGSITPPVGFKNYLGCTSTSSYSSVASDVFVLSQKIEGYNISDLAWGTANAKSVTLSFQVYSSLTGTFSGSLQNETQTRSYPFTFTVSSANTWTSISVTIAGDTTGTWATTSGVGVIINWDLGCGSTYRGTASSWSGSNYLGATSSVSVVGTSGATFYITGVQLEVGTKATPYEMQIYSDQLAQCLRYYRGSTPIVVNPVAYPTTIFTPSMRANPTITGGGTGFTLISQTGDTTTCYQTASANQNLTFSAEL
jgi:hypothetical protein